MSKLALVILIDVRAANVFKEKRSLGKVGPTPRTDFLFLWLKTACALQMRTNLLRLAINSSRT